MREIWSCDYIQICLKRSWFVYIVKYKHESSTCRCCTVSTIGQSNGSLSWLLHTCQGFSSFWCSLSQNRTSVKVIIFQINQMLYLLSLLLRFLFIFFFHFYVRMFALQFLLSPSFTFPFFSLLIVIFLSYFSLLFHFSVLCLLALFFLLYTLDV